MPEKKEEKSFVNTGALKKLGGPGKRYNRGTKGAYNFRAAKKARKRSRSARRRNRA